MQLCTKIVNHITSTQPLKREVEIYFHPLVLT